MEEIIKQNEEAASSILYERRGERRLETLVWCDSIRQAKKQLMMEELSDD